MVLNWCFYKNYQLGKIFLESAFRPLKILLKIQFGTNYYISGHCYHKAHADRLGGCCWFVKLHTASTLESSNHKWESMCQALLRLLCNNWGKCQCWVIRARRFVELIRAGRQPNSLNNLQTDQTSCSIIEKWEKTWITCTRDYLPADNWQFTVIVQGPSIVRWQ